MLEVLIPVLTFITVTTIGGAVIAASAARRQPLQARLRDLRQPYGSDDVANAPALPTLATVARLLPAGNPSQQLRQRLTEAGYHSREAASIFLSVKLLLFVLGATVMAALVLPTEITLPLKVLAMVVAPLLLFFMPNLVIDARRRKRCTEVRMHLPDALDLLEICVSSGMGLDMAWNAVGEEVRRVSPVLGDEMALTNLEIHLGASRTAALRHMAERTDSQELRSLVAILVQSERFGTSVAEALRTFARSMRETRSIQAEEAAEKMAVKMLFPMVVFIFPVVILVAAGPAGIILYQTLGQG